MNVLPGLTSRFPWVVKYQNIAIVGIQIVGAGYFVANHVKVSQVAGPSMLPTFGPYPEVVIEEHISVRLKPDSFRRGELVVASSPLNPGRRICKRILGLPGDVICVDPYDRFSSSESPSVSAPNPDSHPDTFSGNTPSPSHSNYVTVPKGHVWLVGDNVSHSRDSRSYGPVPMGLLRGRVFARLWPDCKLFWGPWVDHKEEE